MFFDQIKDIDGNIRQLRDDLKNIAGAADVHFDQLDDIAAHIIALEALVAVMLKNTNIDANEVKAWIVEATADGEDRPEGSEKAQIVAKQLISTGKFEGVKAA